MKKKGTWSASWGHFEKQSTVNSQQSTENQLCQISTIYTPFERFFDTDQYLTKDHALKI